MTIGRGEGTTANARLKDIVNLLKNLFLKIHLKNFITKTYT